MTMQASTLLTIPRISIGVGIALAVGIILATVGFLLAPAPYREALLFFAAACAAAGQLAVALYTARILQLTIDTQTASATALAEKEATREKQVLVTASLSFSERWTEASMFHARKQCQAIIDMRDRPNEIRELLLTNEESRENISNILNFLEQLAIAVREGACDETFAKRLFGGIVTNVWHATRAWVEDQRTSRSRPQLWAELQALYDRWR